MIGYTDLKTITKTAMVTVDQLATQSTTTLQAITALVIPIGASETWVGMVVLFVTGDATADLRVKLDAPAGGTSTYIVEGARAADTVVTASTLSTDATAVVINRGVSATGTVQRIHFSVVNSTTAGNIGVKFAQDVSTALDVPVIKVGSHIIAHRV